MTVKMLQSLIFEFSLTKHWQIDFEQLSYLILLHAGSLYGGALPFMTL